MEESGRLQSMKLQRVGHDRVTSLSFYSSFWRRKWQPTPVFLPGESHGQRGLIGYSLWGRKESDMTKQLTHTHIQHYISTSVYLIYSVLCFYILVFVWFVHLKKCNSDGKKIIHS